jgi:DNA-binding response OmpR family regulator
MGAFTVIYVEDDETETFLFNLGLSSRGIDVLPIGDARSQTLALLDTPDYRAAKAVFLDLWLADVNGIDLAQHLRSQGDMRPFFLLTAGENPDPDQLHSLGITYIRKPADYDKVAEMVQAL